MKKQRILSFILAVTMILPMAVVGTSAKTVYAEKNSIEIGEEFFVENGDFEGELSLSDKNLRYGWLAMEDGYWYWSTNDKKENNVVVQTYDANVTIEADGDNHYMVVESDTSVCMAYAPVADLPKGEYTLSLQVYPEAGASSLTFDVRKIVGTSHSCILAGGNYVTKPLTANTWNTITIPVVVTDDSADLIFRFWPNPENKPTKFRVDNVSLSRPGDVLIETADMTATSTSATVGKWYVDNNELATATTSNSYVLVQRNSSDNKLPDSSNFAYAFKDKLDKGEYKLTLKIDSVGNQRYHFQLANVSSGWNTIVNPTIDKGTNVINFTVTQDDTPIAFRMWPNQNYPDTFSITGIKLEKGIDPVVYNNTFESASDVITNFDSSASSHNIAWNNEANAAINHFSVNSSSGGADEIEILAQKKVDNNGVLHYKAKTKTPTLAFGLGNLTEGLYTLTFDIYGVNLGSCTPKVHYYNNGAKEATQFTPNPWATFSPAASGWKTITVNFVVDSTTADYPYLFRFWPGGNDPREYYVDNLKLVRKDLTETIVNKTFDDANDFCLSANNLSGAGNPCAWATKTRSDSFFGGNGTLATARIVEITENNQKNKVLRLANLEGTPAFGYNFGWLPKGSYTLTFKTKPLTSSVGYVNRGVYDVSANTLTGITLKTSDIGMTDGQWKNNTVAFDITSDSGAKVLMRIWFNSPVDFYIDDFKIVGTTTWSKHVDKDFSTADQATFSNLGWGVGEDQFAHANGTFNYSTSNGYLDVISTATDNPSFIYAIGNLDVGSYTIAFDVKSSKDALANFNHRYGTGSGASGDKDNISISLYKDYWSLKTLTFTTADTSKPRQMFRIFATDSYKGTSFAIDNLQVWGTAPVSTSEVIYESDFSTAPAISDVSVNILSASEVAAVAGKWFFRDIKPAIAYYNAAKKCIDILPRSSQIHGDNNASNQTVNHPGVKYQFNNVFTKGTYAIAFELTPSYVESYKVLALDAATGNVISSASYSNITAPVNGSLSFSVNNDTNVVFKVCAYNAARCYSAFAVSDVEVYKLSNPVIGINANGAIAQFDAQTGTYYMITGIDGANGYVNYSDDTKLDAGIYRLSGYFKTTDASGVQIGASVGYLPLEETYEIGAEWTKVTYTVTLARDTKLNLAEGVRFTLEGNSTFYFKDLELVFVDELPSPALNSGIAMVLLKKMQGLMKPKVEKKLYNFVPNFDFDEAPTIREGSLGYGWAAQKNGEWAMSLNTADKEGTGSLTWSEYKKEKCLYIEGNKTNPCISYKLPETLEAGLYTLSIDTFVEGAGQKGFMLDVFDMQSGAAVRIGEGAAIMSRSVKAGEWSTMSVTFSAPANASVIFRFWSANASVNYYVDNIKITKPGVFADGSVEEVVNDTEGLIKNGDFAEAPTIASKELGYGWAGAKDGEWAYSLNYNEQKDAKCTLSYGEVKGEKALKVDTNSTPSVSYAVNGKMKPGMYTLSFDVYTEAKGAHSYNIDVFDVSTGSVVRTTAGASTANARVKGGEWTTVSVPFTVTGQADIVFRFYTGSKISFFVDNVTIK